MCGHMRAPNSIYAPDAGRIGPHAATKCRRTWLKVHLLWYIEGLIEKEAKAPNMWCLHNTRRQFHYGHCTVAGRWCSGNFHGSRMSTGKVRRPVLADRRSGSGRRHPGQHKPASGGPFAASATGRTGRRQCCQCRHARWHDSMALRAAAQNHVHTACHEPPVFPKQTAHGRSQALHNSHSMGIRHC